MKAFGALLDALAFEPQRNAKLRLIRHYFATTADPDRGYAWVSKPNRAFGDRAPVEVMAAGDIFSLARVRALLDAERGGW